MLPGSVHGVEEVLRRGGFVAAVIAHVERAAAVRAHDGEVAPVLFLHLCGESESSIEGVSANGWGAVRVRLVAAEGGGGGAGGAAALDAVGGG